MKPSSAEDETIREAARLIQAQFSENHDEIVMVKDIPVHSVCENDRTPYSGRAHVAYIPGKDGRVTGLSKLARVVDFLAARPQIQEKLTTQIADCLDQALKPRGVLIVIDARHVCLPPAADNAEAVTVTSAVRGEFRRRQASRAEALSLIRHP